MLSIILVTLFNLTVQAEDGCVRAYPKPFVNTDSERVTNYSVTKKDKRNIEENFILDKTKHINIKQFGCAHFGIEYSVMINEHSNNPKPILKNALAFIEGLKGVTFFQLRGAEKAIKQSIRNNTWKPGEPITITEGYEWVVVNTSQDKTGKFLLKIVVDIAL